MPHELNTEIRYPILSFCGSLIKSKSNDSFLSAKSGRCIPEGYVYPSFSSSESFL